MRGRRLRPHLAPDVVGDQVDAERPQLRLEVAHVEDDERPVEVDAGRRREDLPQAAVDVALEAVGEAVGVVPLAQHGVEVAQHRRRAAVRARVAADAGAPVGLVERRVERALLPLAQGRAPVGEHQPEQPLQGEQPLGQRIARRPRRRSPRRRQVEGIDAVRRGPGEADVLPAHGLADAPVLVLGVDDVVLDAQHQRPQRLHLAGVGLARAALGEDDLVGVLQLAAEGVEDDQRVVVDADAVEDARAPSRGGSR